ncbi:hypothetical protein AVEN_193357-1 [Araneus ventricosus]|uniref:Uncharacterized protein n=1 Tax=Araneus ventricosus TaxID=182803 RepID=A0A4Y2ESD5_ARAVE|nr:hypothetical protein AVEN_193357-1 [Araneus ventricosus]
MNPFGNDPDAHRRETVQPGNEPSVSVPMSTLCQKRRSKTASRTRSAWELTQIGCAPNKQHESLQLIGTFPIKCFQLSETFLLSTDRCENYFK